MTGFGEAALVLRLGAEADFGTLGAGFGVPDEANGPMEDDMPVGRLSGLEVRGSWSSALRLVPPLGFALVVPFEDACRVGVGRLRSSFFGVEDDAGTAGGRESGV